MFDEGVWSRAPERFLLGRAYHDIAAIIGWDRAIDFGMFVWETRRAPSRSQASRSGKLCGTFYVPQAIEAASMRPVVELIGKDAAEQVVRYFGGYFLEFSSIEHAFRGRRDKAVAEAVSGGSRAAVVAASFGINERTVRRIVRTLTGESPHHFRQAQHA